MMAIASEFILVDSRYQAAARCLVCGNEIEPGQGVTAQYRGRTLRFKCPGCLSRFEADPERFLASQPSGCCADSEGDCSPASEWAYDR